MADVKVGQVRRGRPYTWPARNTAEYLMGPFDVLAAGSLEVLVHYHDTPPGCSHVLFSNIAAGCPLWPDEHEQYKDARGYEVRP